MLKKNGEEKNSSNNSKKIKYDNLVNYCQKEADSIEKLKEEIVKANQEQNERKKNLIKP